MIRAIFFDFFGVFVPESSWEFFRAHQEAFGGDGDFLDRLNEQIDLGKISREQYYQSLAQKTGIPADDIIAEITHGRMLNKELVTLVRALKPNYQIGLISNAGPHEIEILREFKLTPLFDALTISFQVGVTKPDKRIFLKALEGLGVKPAESVFIDDKLSNTDAAEKLGMQAIHYRDFKQMKTDLDEILGVSGVR